MASTTYKAPSGKTVTVKVDKLFRVEVEGLGIYSVHSMVDGAFDLGIITLAGRPTAVKVTASPEAAALFDEWRLADQANFERAMSEEKEYCEGYDKVIKAMGE